MIFLTQLLTNSIDLISVIFAHIDDSVSTPNFDWFYEIKGTSVSNYLSKYTKSIKNSRKMINISSNQIEKELDALKNIFNLIKAENTLKN